MLRSNLLWLLLYVGTFAAQPLVADQPNSANGNRPHWIWSSQDRSVARSARFEKPFTVPNSVVAATLRCVGESTGLTVGINGDPIATLQPYDPLRTVDMTEHLRAGDQTLSVVASAVTGPASFFVQLEIECVDGTKSSIVSDTSWTHGDSSTKGDTSGAFVFSFGEVDQRLTIGKERRVGITAIDNYEQWKQALGSSEGTDPASFVVSAGFEIQLIRSAKPGEDSWISMEFDPQGRLLIAKEGEGLLRMTLSADGDRVVNTECIEETLKECRGLVFSAGDLFANANNSKGLYRLKKIDDDRFAAPELVYASGGGVGHGRNDLAVGPDGMIYSIHGDSVDLPEDAIDYTSPFRDANRGKKTSEGHLLRIDPENGHVEVLAAGLRNPFGIDFNRHGDIFTYDADAEYDMGAPWYRPTRVSELITGGDYGWRGVTRSWPSYYPDHADNARPNLDIGKGSPTAVKFGTHSNFPPRYQEALFILDWAYGRILAVHCLPRGSSYLMTAETFLKGRPLNVTDLGFARDGSLYLVTGGRKTLSAIYRVRYIGDQPRQAAIATPQQLAREAFAAESRELRRELEAALQSDKAIQSLDRAWDQLGNPDPWIAQAATHLIEHAPVAMWKERALNEPDRIRGLRSLLSLSRSGENESLPAILSRLNEIPLDSASRSEKLVALQAYSLCLTPEILARATEKQRIAESRKQLDAIYPDREYAVNGPLSELLVRVQSPDVVTKTIGLLESSTDQSAKMHYLYVLRNVRKGWDIASRRSYFDALAQSRHYVAGDGMSDFLGKIREESIGTLNERELETLAPLLNDDDARDQQQAAEPRPFVKRWTVDEVLHGIRGDEPRDLERGGELFFAASCANCHRVARRGTPMGPNLTAVSRRFSKRDLLTSIIEPSKVIAENYRSVQIVTRDGKSYVGQTVLGGDYRSPRLRLAIDPAKPLQTIEIDKTAIELQKTSPVSWMPAGLLDTLTRDEILDLVAYLESAESSISQ